MRPRIVHVIPTLNWGSAESELLATVCLLGDHAETHVCTTRVSHHFRTLAESYGATIHGIRSSRWTGSLEFRHLSRTIRRLRPDILHLWRVEDGEYLATVIPFVAGTRLIVDQRQSRYHRSDAVNVGRLLLGLAARALHTEPSTPAVICKYIVSFMDDKNATPEGSDSRSSLHERLGLAPSTPVVAVAGWLCRHKRIEDIIWAIDLLQVVRNDVHLVVLGCGPDEVRLRHWVQLTQTIGRVHFVADIAFLGGVWPEFSAMIFASELGDPPLALAEAILNHVPVIVSRIPGHEWFLGTCTSKLAENGLFFEVGDRAEIARAIEQVIDFPDESAARAERAMQQLQENHPIIHIANIDPRRKTPCEFQRSDAELNCIRQIFQRYGIEV